MTKTITAEGARSLAIAYAAFTRAVDLGDDNGTVVWGHALLRAQGDTGVELRDPEAALRTIDLAAEAERQRELKAAASRNYSCPKVSLRWSRLRETHPAVASGIFAISRAGRSPDEIWEAPTDAEWDHVTMAVEEYVRAGLFPAEDDGRYPWGFETIEGPHA